MADEIKLGLDVRDVVAEAKKAEAAVRTMTDALKNSVATVNADAAARTAAAGAAKRAGGEYEVLARAVDDLGGSYEVLARDRDAEAAAMVEETRARKIALQMVEEATAANRAAGRSAEVHTSATSKLGAAAQTAADRQKDMSRAALLLSQQLQDVAQGGLASALNGIDGITLSLGRAAGMSTASAAKLSAALLGIGTAALVAAPYVKQLLDAMLQGPHSLPAAGEALGRLQGDVKGLQAELNALRESWDGSGASLARYVELTARLADAEKQANAERERANLLDAARKKSRDEQAKPDAEAREKAATLAGDPDKLIADVQKTLVTQEDQADRKRMLELQKQAAAGITTGKGPVADARATRAAAMELGEVQARVVASEAARREEATRRVTDFLDAREGSGKGLDAVLGTTKYAAAEPAAVKADRERLDRNEAEMRKEENRQDQLAMDRAEAAKQAKAAEKADAENDGKGRRTGGGRAATRPSALANTAPDPFEGVNSFEDLATKFDDQGNRVETPDEYRARMMEEIGDAGIRRRSAAGRMLKKTAGDYGIDLSEAQASLRGAMAEQGQMNGMSQTEAVMAALERLITINQDLMLNQQMLADRVNQYGGRIDVIRQGAARVPSLLNYGSF